MKRIFFLAVIGVSCFVFAESVEIPYQIGRIRRDKVCIDFSRADPLMLAEGATLNDVSAFAADILEQYLKPCIKAGKISPRFVQLLNFCCSVQFAQVKRLRQTVEDELGVGIRKDGSLAFRQFCFIDGPIPPKKSFADLLAGLRFEIDNKTRSYCRLYNTKLGKHFLFANEEKILDPLYKSRENPDKMCMIALDPECYGEYPQLKWATDGLSGRTLCMAGCAATGGVVGGIVAAKGIAVAAAVGWIPGPGWVVGGAAMIGSSAAAAAWWWYSHVQSKKWLQAIKLKDEDIRTHMLRVGDRMGYLGDVIEDYDCIYQQSYLRLVDVAMLVDEWRQLDSFGVKGVSDKQLKLWNTAADEMRSTVSSALTSLEDSFVNYPLMVELVEASSICLYLNYLDYKAGSKESRAETENIRKFYLANSEKVGDFCSHLAVYSTGRQALAHINAYNAFFDMTYATNRVGLIASPKKKEVEAYFKNGIPLFENRDKVMVEAAHIKIGNASEYSEQYKAYILVRGCPLLTDIVRTDVGDEVLRKWEKEVEERTKNNWLYPSWSEKAKQWIPPEYAIKIATLSDVFSNPKRQVQRICLIIDATVSINTGLVSMVTFRDKIAAADTLEDAKSALLSNILRHKIPDELQQRIIGRYGKLDAMIDAWIEIILAEQKETNKDVKPFRLEVIAGRIQDEILPVWKQIDSLPWKFGRWWF